MIDYLGHLESAAASLAGALRRGDLEAPVLACPGWTLRDLGVHVAGAHHWARGAILEGHPRTPPPEPPADTGPAALADWYLGHASELRHTLACTDPEAPCWTFGPKPSTVAFWHRRQAHETTVHAWDADPASRVDLALAVDGIDEVVRMFFPRQVRLRRMAPLAGSLALAPDDLVPSGTPARWVLTGDGLTPHPSPVGDVDATVSGPADVLYLLLWGRIDVGDGRVRISGDADAARRILTSGIVP
ncbi:MAG TPA: maleylpyruvate isomerase family mycothiol-dependent enzyme [Candidatus Lustribacter sp.]|nr:maleylpyruvate isomerase family mycothiol-dependent enzyme [Candidatus Lustribacter sp.]